MKKVLIVGGAGFIGSHILDALLKLKYNITVVDDLSTGNYENIQGKDCMFYAFDIGTDEGRALLHKAMKGIDYVFSLAAIPRTQYCVENPASCHAANVTGMVNVLDACIANKIKKIIHSSSCGIYGIQDILPIKENAPIKHGTPYSLQKYMQELYIGLYHDLYGLSAISLRYFNVYGTQRQTEKGAYPNVLPAFSKQKREQGRVFITGDGKQSRDMVHVSDVVNANIMAMESDLKDGEAFNIGTGNAVTINAIAKYFNCPAEYIPPRPGEALHLYADTALVEKMLKWKAKIQIDEGMKIYFSD